LARLEEASEKTLQGRVLADSVQRLCFCTPEKDEEGIEEVDDESGEKHLQLVTEHPSYR
jgi:hypothetical protein